jgi:hypothetical protein
MARKYDEGKSHGLDRFVFHGPMFLAIAMAVFGADHFVAAAFSLAAKSNRPMFGDKFESETTRTAVTWTWLNIAQGPNGANDLA